MSSIDTTTANNPHQQVLKYDPQEIFGPNYSDRHGYGSAIVLNSDLPDPVIIPRENFKIEDSTGRPKIELYVTSEKELKWKPAVKFVVNLMKTTWADFSQDDITLRTLKVDSGIAEQPIGREAGLLGARGRCKDARISAAINSAIGSGENVMVISFENTIAIEPLNRSMPTNWFERYEKEYFNEQKCVPIDVAAIYLHVVAGYSSFECTGFSDGVTLPFKYLNEAELLTTDSDLKHGYDVTCGKLINRDTGLPDANWHTGFTGYSRDQLLNDGIESMAIRIY